MEFTIGITVEAIVLELAAQLQNVSKTVNYQTIDRVMESLTQAYRNKEPIYLYGAGRSGFTTKCLTQRLMHLGYSTVFISDSATKPIGPGSVLILTSGSGNTTSTVAMAERAKSLGAFIILFTASDNSKISPMADLVVRLNCKNKETATEVPTLAPYTSHFDISCLALYDSICGCMMNRLGLSEADIHCNHANLE